MKKIALITFIDTKLAPVACDSEAVAISSLGISYWRLGGVQTQLLNGLTAVFNRGEHVATIRLIEFMAEPTHL